MNPYMRRRILGSDRRETSRRRRLYRDYPQDERYEDGYDEAPRRRRDMDYEDYPRRDYEYDYEPHGKMRLSRQDMHEWEHGLRNADGSRGAKFTKEQVMEVVRQRGLRIQDVTEDEFVLAVNVLYSDYCCALRDSSMPNVDRPEPYVHMAKAFLFDGDFEGTPEEKLALYFYSIVEYDE